MFDYPLWGLFLGAFLSSTLLPGGSEAVLAYLTGQQGHSLALLLIVAAAGNTLGGMTSWLVGRVIAMRYPAEQIVSPMDRSLTVEPLRASFSISSRRSGHPASRETLVLPVRQSPPTKNSDEGRVGRVRPMHHDTGDSGNTVLGTHPAEAMGERVLPRHSSLVPRPSAKAVERLRRWGAPVLLLSWLPIIGDPLCVAAGWLKIHWLLSLALIGIGKTARYLFVIYLFA